MKLRCAILDDYQNVALKMADWPSLSDKIDIHSYTQHFETEKELVQELLDYSIIIAMRERTTLNESVLSQLPHLKLLVTSGMNNPSIEIKYATSRGIVVSGTASSSISPAELTWALLLALARNVSQENLAFRGGGAWQSSVGVSLQGKRLGIIGLGKIGNIVAKYGKAFGMDVIGWSANLTAERAEELRVKLAQSKEELLQSSDFVSIHVRLSNRTLGLIGAQEFSMMKPSAFIINTSRSQIWDSEALVNALKTHQIAGAASDVFDIEPLPQSHPLRTLPNFLGTPHLGYVTDTNYKTYFKEAVENIEAFLKGNPIRRLQ